MKNPKQKFESILEKSGKILNSNGSIPGKDPRQDSRKNICRMLFKSLEEFFKSPGLKFSKILILI